MGMFSVAIRWVKDYIRHVLIAPTLSPELLVTHPEAFLGQHHAYS